MVHGSLLRIYVKHATYLVLIMPRPKKRLPRKIASDKMSGGDDSSGAQLDTPAGVPLGPGGSVGGRVMGVDTATVGTPGSGSIITADSSETTATPTELGGQPNLVNSDSQQPEQPFMSPTGTPASSDRSQHQPKFQPKEEFDQELHQHQNNDASDRAIFQHIKLTTEQILGMNTSEVSEKWSIQDRYISSLHEKLEALTKEVEELRGVRERETRLKGQLAEAQRKEQYHIMRLASKEHELQDMGAQVQELKGLSSNMGGLKHCLLDPAVNLLFERLKRDLETARTKMEETQNELSAWKFTPDSNTGKQLMAKCRLLIKENEELGRMIASGRLAKLEGDLALQKNFSEELKKSQSDLDEFLLEMDEDTEGMQGTIYYLQQQLRKEKERVAILSAQINNSTTQTNTPTTTPLPPIPHDDDNARDAADVDISVARTEEQHHQPNGDTIMQHSGTSAAGIAITSDTPVDSPDVNSSSQSGAATLTNGGRKRTQSEADEEVNSAHGVGDVLSGGEERESPLTPAKRTRTEGGADDGELTVGDGGDPAEEGNNAEFTTDSTLGEPIYNGVADS